MMLPNQVKVRPLTRQALFYPDLAKKIMVRVKGMRMNEALFADI